MLIAAQIIVGLLLLVAGGEFLVKGAVALAKRFGIPTIIVGLTVVSLGTSAPEMVVSIMATLRGAPDIALGNVIGSNIANVLLVLGMTAIVYPVVADPKTAKTDGVFMVLISIILLLMMQGGVIGRIEGGLLVTIMVIYLLHLRSMVKRGDGADIIEELEEETAYEAPLWKAALLTVGGIALLVVGAEILVGGASELARLLGVSEAVIGLTIIAMGTSAPELMTCVVAAYRKHSDIALGNIIGSNIFNILAVLGVASFIHPIDVNPMLLDVDVWVMLAASVILVPMMLTDRKISRFEGSLFLGCYIGYIIYQYLGINQS